MTHPSDTASPTLAPRSSEDQEKQEGKYLTFVLGDECYGLDIGNVTEIIGLQKITSVPDVPAYVKGVINLRGKVIPVMDIRLRFGMPPREYDDRTCIIVINVGINTIGLVVDTVSEVLDIDAAQIESARSLTGSGGKGYIQGLGKVGDSVKILLDAEMVVSNVEIGIAAAQAAREPQATGGTP